MTKTKITSRIHQGAQGHQQEAFDHHHMVSQRNFQETEIGKIAEHLVTDQEHVTDRHTTKKIEDRIEAKVERDLRTRIKDQIARIKEEIQDHIEGAVQAQVMKEGLLKL